MIRKLHFSSSIAFLALMVCFFAAPQARAAVLWEQGNSATSTFYGSPSTAQTVAGDSFIYTGSTTAIGGAGMYAQANAGSSLVLTNTDSGSTCSIGGGSGAGNSFDSGTYTFTQVLNPTYVQPSGTDGCMLINGDHYDPEYLQGGQFRFFPATIGGEPNKIYFEISDASGTPPVDTSTHIIDFTPEDATTTSNPVLFSLHAYINPDDIGSQFQITFTLHNIDQNVLLASAFSPSDIFFLQNVVATTSGDFYYSTSTTVGEGNYRINAILQKNFLWGWVKDPFSPVNENLSHQFIVGQPTLIGTLTQNGFSELNGHLASTTATSSIALVESSCNPLSGFSMTDCLTGLFVPDATALQTTIDGFQAGVLTRAPWGYFTRVYDILNSTTTGSLPTYTVEIALNNASDTTTLSFDPGDMIAGAGALLASTTDPYNGKNLRDVAEPIVQLVIALGVVLTIIADLTGSHRHQTAEAVRTRRRV